jgi:hypothetical protein
MNAVSDDTRARLRALRELIAEKYPSRATRPGRRRLSGYAPIDRERGGLLRGAVTEVTGSASGALVLLSAILRQAVEEGFHVGLVDGTSSFHPADWPDAQLQRVLWVMCRDSAKAVKAADLLVRDGNLPMLVLDLQGMSARELRKIPASTWHRFHRLMEERDSVLLVLTSQPMVEGAVTRIALEPVGDLSARLRDRHALSNNLRVRIFERGAVNLNEATRRIA